MSRNRNIELSKASDEIIINELKKHKNFISIDEIKDSQQDRDNIQGMDKLYNEINMYWGIDYVLVMRVNNKPITYYIDTKGFEYDKGYHGELKNGIVETMLLQIEKQYRHISYKGWANNPYHRTNFIIILLNNHLYYIDYSKLVKYCNKLQGQLGTVIRSINKSDGSIEHCIVANVDDMRKQGVIINIKPIVNLIGHIA